MTTDREFEGKDLAEALAAASAGLGVAEPDLDYEIVDQGRRGLFGIGAKSVRIRVMPPLDHEMPVAGPSRRREAQRSESAAEATPDKSRRRRRRRGSRSGRGAEPRREQVELDAAAIAAEVKADDSPPAPEEAVEQVRQAVESMIGELGLEVEVRAKAVAGGTEIEFDGADQERLVEEDAEPIAAFQFLLNRMSRRAFPDAGRIHVYCNGHRETRDEDLIALAQETAARVLEDGQPQRLRPMNSYERRLVHVTVRKLRGVDSRSEGDGAMKRVRVFKRRRRRRGRGQRPSN